MAGPPRISPELRKLIDSVQAKRPRTVLQHILKHGQVTTEELKDLYGYDHPPRAAMDVKEHGIPLKRLSVVSEKSGRTIRAYALDLEAAATPGRTGRRAIPKAIKTALLERDGPRCAVCGAPHDPTALQVDHRVPVLVAGGSSEARLEDFMLVCVTCNRAKSWACEHCENGVRLKQAKLCLTCMWASPDDYTHIALEERRSVTITWIGGETREYDALAKKAAKEGRELPDFAKDALRRRK